jgi:non-ribosomal peptide synthetase component E (peptide arylation enzyme)
MAAQRKNKRSQEFNTPMCSHLHKSEPAKFKLPKRVFVASELPRNAMGKVQKTDLSAKYRTLFKG